MKEADYTMEQGLQTFFSFAVIIMAILSFYYSMKYRRSDSPKFRGLYAARMNICMGIMLLGIAMIQIILFDTSTVRVIVGSIFLLIGLFNLFAGLRNHSIYSRQKE